MRPDWQGAGMRDTKVPFQTSYNGDRILVNKYLYTFTDPKRWDVVVFKFPGDAKINYIKRLVGLPGETLRIYQGDIFIKPPGAAEKAEFPIERKPPDKVLAMRQLVHDTDHDPAELDAAGWPLRWHAPPGDDGKWQVEKTVAGEIVQQKYNVDATGEKTSWLRYENLVPTYEIWQQVEASRGTDGASLKPFAGADRSQWRRLVMDANPYNGRMDRSRFGGNLQIDPSKLGLHWVGDLMVEADVDIASSNGQLVLDLVEAGKHFSCTFDLKTGEATLGAANVAGFAPRAKTSVVAPGKHHLGFANVDDQLLLWVDGSLVHFDGDTAYDANKVFGERSNIRPQTSDTDLGDFAPVGIGARDAKLTVTRLQVWRDLYYIADRDERNGGKDYVVTDFNHPFERQLLDLATTPALWGRFGERNQVEFPIADTQLFVMGDNSAESSDARLWSNGDPRGSRPGGAYLDKRLLIGKALCVYWPHSWNRIPGTPIPFPLFPNVADMRLVR
jgi:signal peptidase I